MTDKKHLILVALLALAASAAQAAGYEGTYTVQNQSLTVHTRIGLKLGTRSEAVETSRKLDIGSGQLPLDTFVKEKDAWANKIISWRLWPKQREIVAIASVNRAYDDLLARLNRLLRCFAERMTVRKTGVFAADLKLEDDQCGQTATVRAGYDASKGSFKAAKLTPADLAFRPGWLVLGGSGATLGGSLAQGRMNWDVKAILVGVSYGGGAVTVGLDLQGTSALARVPQ
ncbi:MAG TPA: hypothetical protein VF179_05645 [Thermoanaerobaculia bacterium]|nr:hypothetical protein [Thermoanaerobaculia bacterium]